MLHRLPACSLGLLIASSAFAQGNLKSLYNANHRTGHTRTSTTAAETLYALQPDAFRCGYGDATGFQLDVRDSEQGTKETVIVGFVQITSGKPDPTKVLGTANFDLFGTSSGPATKTFTLTLASKITLTPTSSQCVTLPKPVSASDVLSLGYQLGSSTKVPATITKKQWTFVQSGTAANAVLAVGSVWHMAGMYDAPVVGLYNRTTAYGPAEDLTGIESLYFDSSRGDALGYYIQARNFKNEWAIIVLSGAKLASPIPSPHGPFLIDSKTAVALPLPVKLDANGFAKTGSVPVPSITVTLWDQGAAVDFTKSVVATSDASAGQIIP